jgi:hypothetical protein
MLENIKVDQDAHTLSHGSLNSRVMDLEISNAEIRTEQKAILRSAKGYSVLITTVVSALIGGLLKWLGTSSH